MLNFPVGFYNFSSDEGLNFQLNRFYSSGFLGYDELMDIGKKVTSFESWIELFTKLAEEAAAEGNVKKSAVCYRTAQFYTLGDVKDDNGRLLKVVLYEKCMDAYAKYYDDVEGLTYERIPYQTGYLPVYYMIRKGKSKGTIVIHGGYDSFVQEFLGLLIYFNQLGFNVYFFEGPGQGEVLYRCGMRMTHEWEHCVSTVLDYFKLDDVTLIGISLGGYLATRAAAYESRIKRLVMFDLIYDFNGSIKARMGKVKGYLFDYLTSHPGNSAWKVLEKKFDEIYFTKWLLKQDTLVLAGEKDLYTVFYKDQISALTNARSVEGRLFTEKESADHHWQIGNIKLVLDVITEWIERKK